ncbi:cellulose binding domain-containing protein [Plasmopara halstedii]|uniref:Cellulose binding domain-containing protein n=1 Tax=Plasmopara halstedii TaxID=4781 RepID=A0A0P1AD02_PLAHL|nr:cellulose binding domain-containing protein [Plasmopara halstedii]CEG38385.1 cellulose binding domain-containing protein [Plasmopara halstedii]|eukprot:XP_024574754.1 cellulose binding domain-containing protein [Plasmopara halstedii]
MVKFSLSVSAAVCALIKHYLLIEAVILSNDSNITAGGADLVLLLPIHNNSFNLSAGTTSNTSVDFIEAPVVNLDSGSAVLVNNTRLSNVDVYGDEGNTTTRHSVENATSAIDPGFMSHGSSVDDDSSTADGFGTTGFFSDNDGSVSLDSSLDTIDASIDAGSSRTSHDTTDLTTVNGDGSLRTDLGANEPSDGGDQSVLDDIDFSKAPSSTPIAPHGPSPITGQVKLVPGHSDCGGLNFNYTIYMPTSLSTVGYTMLSCEQGYRCQEVEDSHVYRCSEWPSRTPVSFYGQCGGGDYDGQTFCAPGAVCKYISASFSQCLPTY